MGLLPWVMSLLIGGVARWGLLGWRGCWQDQCGGFLDWHGCRLDRRDGVCVCVCVCFFFLSWWFLWWLFLVIVVVGRGFS